MLPEISSEFPLPPRRPDLPALPEPGNQPEVKASLQRILKELGAAQKLQELGTEVDRADVFQRLVDLETIIADPNNGFLLKLKFQEESFLDVVRANVNQMTAKLLGIEPTEPVITSVDQVPAEIRRQIEEQARQKATEELKEELKAQEWESPRKVKWLQEDLESARKMAEINYQKIEDLKKKLSQEIEFSYRLLEELHSLKTTKDKLPDPIVIGNEAFVPKKRLAGGKYGEVYLADWISTENEMRIVVLKVENMGLNEEEKQVFNGEIETLHKLGLYQHQSLGINEEDWHTPVPLKGGTTSEGRDYIAMTLAKGRPLDELFRENKKFDLSAIRNIGRQLCLVFEALHNEVKKGYLDFQPKNVFWDEGMNKITVIDWNLLTTYFQYMNEAEKRKAIRNDIESIGKVLFRLATDQAYQTNLPIEKQIGLVPENLGLRFVISKALAEKPDEQYVSVEQMKQSLT